MKSLQTSATQGAGMTDAERHKAGYGGSYVQDPRTGTVKLQQTTEGDKVSLKAEGAPKTRPAPQGIAPGAVPRDTASE